MTFFDCTADLVGQLNGNGQKGMLQIAGPYAGNKMGVFFVKKSGNGFFKVDLSSTQGAVCTVSVLFLF